MFLLKNNLNDCPTQGGNEALPKYPTEKQFIPFRHERDGLGKLYQIIQNNIGSLAKIKNNHVNHVNNDLHQTETVKGLKEKKDKFFEKKVYRIKGNIVKIQPSKMAGVTKTPLQCAEGRRTLFTKKFITPPIGAYDTTNAYKAINARTIVHQIVQDKEAQKVKMQEKRSSSNPGYSIQNQELSQIKMIKKFRKLSFAVNKENEKKQPLTLNLLRGNLKDENQKAIELYNNLRVKMNQLEKDLKNNSGRVVEFSNS